MKLFRKNSISRKLLLSFFIMGFLPLLVFSIFSQSASKKSIMDMAKTQAETSLDLISYNIDMQFKHYFHLAYFITKDAQLCALGNAKNAQEINENLPDLEKLTLLMQGYRSSVRDVALAGVALQNGVFFSNLSRNAKNMDFSSQRWYTSCMRNPGKTLVFVYPPNGSPFEELILTPVSTITACRAIVDEAGTPMGASVVMMNNRVLEQSMSNVLGRKGSFVYIVDEQNTIVYSPIVSEIPKVTNPQSYVTVTRENPQLGWTIVGNVLIDDALRQIDRLQGIMLVCMIVLLIIVVGFSLPLSRGLVMPIFTLNRLMKQAEGGALDVQFTPTGKDEINELGQSFNVMITKLSALLTQVYQEQKAKRMAEMAALQANIKPHFLYNTLETISYMARRCNARDIVETVEALSTLFRVSLSKGSESIPIEQEILHVSSYLQIQKVRYEDMLTYSVTMTQDCKGLSVQKLIIQPLVENALYHGIKESGHDGNIDVQVWRTADAVYISVQDDGIGMTAERLEQVRQAIDGRKNQSGAYGVVNVQERLVLSYGERYGLRMHSLSEEGTVCVICHPVK